MHELKSQKLRPFCQVRRRFKGECTCRWCKRVRQEDLVRHQIYKRGWRGPEVAVYFQRWRRGKLSLRPTTVFLQYGSAAAAPAKVKPSKVRVFWYKACKLRLELDSPQYWELLIIHRTVAGVSLLPNMSGANDTTYSLLHRQEPYCADIKSCVPVGISRDSGCDCHVSADG